MSQMSQLFIPNSVIITYYHLLPLVRTNSSNYIGIHYLLRALLMCSDISIYCRFILKYHTSYLIRGSLSNCFMLLCQQIQYSVLLREESE
jgi:hypothetical protein